MVLHMNLNRLFCSQELCAIVFLLVETCNLLIVEKQMLNIQNSTAQNTFLLTIQVTENLFKKYPEKYFLANQ